LYASSISARSFVGTTCGARLRFSLENLPRNTLLKYQPRKPGPQQQASIAA